MEKERGIKITRVGNGVLPCVSKRVFNIWEHNIWGNSIQWRDYENRNLYGFIKNPKVKFGDEFRDKMESGKVMRFEVIELDYKYNPTDMFFATVKDIGYL
jgi:hypothetical protein